MPVVAEVVMKLAAVVVVLVVVVVVVAATSLLPLPLSALAMNEQDGC